MKIIIAIILLIVQLQSVFSEEWISNHSIKNTTYDIVFQGKQEEDVYNGRSKNTFQFLITNQLTHKNILFKFTEFADQIRNATIACQEFLTFCAFSEFNNVGLQYIVDIQQSEVVDVIPYQWISFSPSKRYIVYETGYPKMISPDFRKSFLCLYDMDRIHDTMPLNKKANRFPANLVGWPLYPEEYVITQDATISSDSGRLSPILWNKEEDQIIFIAFNEEYSYNAIILIDIKHGVDFPKIISIPIDTTALFDLSKMTESIKKEYLDNNKKMFYLLVERLEWSGNNSIRVFPYQKESWIKEYIDFSLIKN